MNRIARIALQTCVLGLGLALAGCSSVFDATTIDYKSAGKAPSLDVPPDLTQLSREGRFATASSGAVTASGYQAGQATSVVTSSTAANAMGDVRIERAGAQRWLVVNRPADQLWAPLREFWQDNGFLLSMDEPSLGIMETDWAENRAKLPQDFIRNTIGKVLESLYSTGERDRFRTRLERTAPGTTEVFISHRGMIEVYSNKEKDQTIWQPRPTDAELEAEFLRRLMLKLGGSAQQSKALVASGAPKSISRVANVNNTPVVQIDEGFDRAWRRVGLTLDRTGFTVEDRDRNQGTYFVRYVPPTDGQKEPGFFSKLFSSTPTAKPAKYRISLRSDGEATTVSVLDTNGKPETSDNARRIVQVIADDIR